MQEDEYIELKCNIKDVKKCINRICETLDNCADIRSIDVLTALCNVCILLSIRMQIAKPKFLCFMSNAYEYYDNDDEKKE